MRTLFISGIGTDVGKTIVSAIIAEKLEANYWKPIQAGSLELTDTDTVKGLVSNETSVFNPETYRLKNAMSPHAAADLEDIDIEEVRILEEADKYMWENPLIIEGAGGLMVPVNKELLFIDLVEKLDVPVVLVVKNYLGSINHTLLSIDALTSRGIEIEGIVFNGESNAASEEFILNYSGIKCLGRIPVTGKVDKEFIKSCTALIDIE